MERIMNEENEWDHNMKAELVEGPVERVSQEEVVKAIREMKAGKAAGPLEVNVKMIAASCRLGDRDWCGVQSCVRVCWMEEECRMSGC